MFSNVIRKLAGCLMLIFWHLLGEVWIMNDVDEFVVCLGDSNRHVGGILVSIIMYVKGLVQE